MQKQFLYFIDSKMDGASNIFAVKSEEKVTGSLKFINWQDSLVFENLHIFRKLKVRSNFDIKNIKANLV